MLYYSIAPVAAATLLAFAALWISHARALKFAGTRLGEHRLYAQISTLALLALGWFIAAGAIDNWTVVRFAGSRGLPAAATAWHDAVFNQPLSFYLFDLPFYSLLRGYVLAVVIVCILVYWVAARGWQLRHRLPDLRDARELDPASFTLEGGLESRFLRGAVRGPAAGLRPQVLPGPLRDGLQRARQLPGRHRLRRSEHRASAAMAGDLRLPRRRRYSSGWAAGSSPA